jgi:hypothetical protein
MGNSFGNNNIDEIENNINNIDKHIILFKKKIQKSSKKMIVNQAFLDNLNKKIKEIIETNYNPLNKDLNEVINNMNKKRNNMQKEVNKLEKLNN